MAIEIKMPQLSDTMSSGKIVIWKKKEGDKVSRGEALAEVETDKANLEIECFHPGVLLKIVTPEGGTAAVGEAIAFVGAAGEAVGSPTAAKAAVANVEAPPAASPQPTLETATANSSVVSTQDANNSGRVIASPLAKKIANDSNVDLSSMRGSGPGGRIIKKDVDAAITGGSTAPQVQAVHPAYQSTTQTADLKTEPTETKNLAPAAASNFQQAGSGRLTPFSKMRETIARRMQESVSTSPHFFVSTSINMGEASKLRELLKERPDYKGISVNHLIIKAAAYALSKESSVNCAVKDGQLYTPDSINIGIVTSIPDGLLIPVIKDANRLSLKDIVFEAKAAIDRAKAGRPSSSDLSGGTFSISNMGMFDVENFTAIISPGQGAILAVSSTKEVVVVEKGQFAIAKQMKVTLSSDHRIIDGIMGANFLKHFKDALEIPALLGLD